MWGAFWMLSYRFLAKKHRERQFYLMPTKKELTIKFFLWKLDPICSLHAKSGVNPSTGGQVMDWFTYKTRLCHPPFTLSSKKKIYMHIWAYVHFSTYLRHSVRSIINRDQHLTDISNNWMACFRGNSHFGWVWTIESKKKSTTWYATSMGTWISNQSRFED